MARFSFPVPGRKPKPQQPPIQASYGTGPLSKAQKILGTTEINIDSPRQWDELSTQSGISISISESTASQVASPRRLGSVSEEGVFRQERRDAFQWEQESETVPAYIRANRLSKIGSSDMGGKDARSDASSLRRRTSTSTIMSWYDKAKMPLSISQQTSASAMAKGLPNKASEMLDVDNVVSPPRTKKKPARLDFTHLLPRHRSHGGISTGGASQSSSLILGADLITKSPSLASISMMSPGAAPPPIRQRNNKKLSRKGTRESLGDVTSPQTATSTRPDTASSGPRIPTEAATAGLRQLYEHYEQNTFRSVMGSPVKELSELDEFPLPTIKHSPPQPKPAQNLARPIARKPDPSTNGRPHPFDIFPPTPVSALPTALPTPAPTPVASLDRDCSASISSRHTKTSKASKRTNRSLGDSDLQERSVLSLSSDSEDDAYIDLASKSAQSASSVRRPSDSDEGSSPVQPGRAAPHRSGQVVDQGSRKAGKHASFAPESRFLTIPNNPGIAAPKLRLNPRTSSLPMPRHPPPTQPLPTPSVRSASRMSTMSSASITSSVDWHSRPGYGVQHAQVVAVLPAATKSRSVSDDQASLSSRRSNSTKAASLRSSADQPTPPLSPSSVDFYIRPAGSSVDANGNHNPRFMAVTRQEEMLLAALRMKRARMRETIISEYEEDGRSGSPHRHRHVPSQATIKESSLEQLPQRLRHQGSATSSSTLRAEEQSAQIRTRRGSASSDQNIKRNGPVSTPASESHSDPSPTSRLTPFRGSKFARDVSPSVAKQERVLLFLDRPKDNVDTLDHAEPSPDLSDFMDFDNGTEDDDELDSDELSYHRRQVQDLVSARSTSRERGRVGTRSASAGQGPETQILVVETDVEDARIGMPRPDSPPISPDEPLPLPSPKLSKKKAVRLSAVGKMGMEAGWWGDDG